MINIVLYENALVVDGHAGYNEHGLDIVCAGVSAVTIGACNWFDPEDVNIEIKDGYLCLVINNTTSDNINKLHLIELQLLAIYQKYQDYINFENKKEFIKI